MRALTLPIDLSKNLLRLIGGIGYLLLDTARATRLALFSKRGRRLGWSNLWADRIPDLREGDDPVPQLEHPRLSMTESISGPGTRPDRSFRSFSSRKVARPDLA